MFLGLLSIDISTILSKESETSRHCIIFARVMIPYLRCEIEISSHVINEYLITNIISPNIRTHALSSRAFSAYLLVA